MISSIYKFESWATLSNLATPCTFWVLAYVRHSWASAASKRSQGTFGLAKGWLHLWQVDVAQHLRLCNHDRKMAQGCARSGKFTLNFPDASGSLWPEITPPNMSKQVFKETDWLTCKWLYLKVRAVCQLSAVNRASFYIGPMVNFERPRY